MKGPRHTDTYRGWDIYLMPEGHYLIAEEGDMDYMQRPFKNVNAAQRFIDAYWAKSPQREAEAQASTYPAMCWSLMRSRRFWLNPGILFFGIAAYVGTFMGPYETTLGRDLLKTTASLAMCFFLIAAVWSGVSYNMRRAKQAAQQQPRPVRVATPVGSGPVQREEPTQPRSVDM